MQKLCKVYILTFWLCYFSVQLIPFALTVAAGVPSGPTEDPEETEGGGSSSSYKGTSPRSHQIVAFARAESRPSRLESLCGSLLGHQSWGMPRCSHTRRGRIHDATAVTGRRDPVRPVLRGEGRGGEGGEGGRQGRLVFRRHHANV